MTWALANWKLLLVGILLALLGIQTLRIAELEQDAAEQRANDAEARLLADRAQRTEEQRRAAAVAQEASNAQSQIASLEGDLRRAGAASVGVRDAAAGAVVRARARTCAATPGPSEPSADAIGVLADVLSRADQRAGVLAEHADRLRIAGAACERSYDSLTQ